MVGPAPKPKLLGLADCRNLQRSEYQLSSKETLQYKMDLHQTLMDRDAHLAAVAILEEHAYHLRSIISSPVRFLPVEILNLIFQEVCTENLRSAPIVLASICYRWRAVALSSPKLWSRILVWPKEKRDAMDNIASTFLSRSQSAPLLIDVTTESTSLVSTLCGHAERWVDATLDVSAECLRTAYTTLDKKRMPKLRALTVTNVMDWTESEFAGEEMSLFQDISNLHMLRLGGGGVELSKHPLPFSEAKSVILAWMAAPLGILRAIALCTTAAHLSINDAYLMDSIDVSSTSTFPHVVTPASFLSFRVTQIHPLRSRFQHILHRMKAPAMISLKIAANPSRSYPQWPFDLRDFRNFVHRSHESEARMTRLEILGVRVVDHSLIKLLEETPLLTELYLVQAPAPAAGSLTEALIQRLTIEHTQQPPPLVPCLKALLLNWQHNSKPLKMLTVMRMIESRASVFRDGEEMRDSELKRATIVAFNGVQDETVPAAKEIMGRLPHSFEFKLL